MNKARPVIPSESEQHLANVLAALAKQQSDLATYITILARELPSYRFVTFSGTTLSLCQLPHLEEHDAATACRPAQVAIGVESGGAPAHTTWPAPDCVCGE